jgi:hypothetical protein
MFCIAISWGVVVRLYESDIVSVTKKERRILHGKDESVHAANG